MKLKDLATGILDGDVMLSVWAKSNEPINSEQIDQLYYKLDLDIPAFPKKYMECEVKYIFAIEHYKDRPCLKIEVEVEE